MRHVGSCNLWDSEEVAAWEQRERAYALMQNDLAEAPPMASLASSDQHPESNSKGIGHEPRVAKARLTA